MDNNNLLLSHRESEPERSTLYIVGTPIGNLNDISQRAINILSNVHLIACEDTRITLKLMHHLEISNKLISFHQHNSKSKFKQILAELKKGNSIALVSDAGMPLISDPGESLVKQIKSHGYDVICIPGPCAAIAGLISSGINASQFVFYGFIPKYGKERQKTIESIYRNTFTSIIFESPKRLKKLLNELKDICGNDREIQVLKELTKKFEKHIGNNLYEVTKYFKEIEPRGEFTIILSGFKKNESDIKSDNNLLRDELIMLIEAGLSHSKASIFLAKKHNISRSKIYNLLLNNELN